LVVKKNICHTVQFYFYESLVTGVDIAIDSKAVAVDRMYVAGGVAPALVDNRAFCAAHP